MEEQKTEQITIPTETLDFFDRDELRARVFYEKYTLRNENGDKIEKTPPEMWRRVSNAMASAEETPEKQKEWANNFYWLLENFKFVPGGRILFGAGQTKKTTLLNCYVIPMKADSIESIFDWCKEAARTYSFGGGVGGDISILRPRGTKVNNSALHSTGSVSFMNIMSETTGTIGQAGRRGALMITIRVDHPDVLDFIRVKRNLRNVRYANISLRITDEFMHAVEKDTDFTLWYDSPKTGRFEKKVRARELWNEIISSARDWAEPGLIFWDNVVRGSPSEYNGMNVITTNPCVTGETPVLTPEGWKRVDSLSVGEEIVTAYGTNKPITEIYVHENEDVYTVKFTDGGELKATKGHIFHSRKGKIKDKIWSKFWNTDTKLSDLKVGDMVRVPKIVSVPNNPVDTRGINYREYGLMLGVLLGDGCYTPKIVERGHAKIASDFRENEWNQKIIRTFKKVSDNISVTTSSGNGCYILLQKQGTEFITKNTLLKPAKSFEKELPLEYINSNKELHLGIIDGLISTDGNVHLNKVNPMVRLSSTSRKLLEGAKSILAFYGIHAKIYSREVGEHKIGGRHIIARHTAHTLHIYGHDLAQFAATFSLSHPEKQKKLERLRDMSQGASSDFAKIKSIEYSGKATVYDIFEKETDTWITNGYASRGCAEQPLQAYGACDLGHVNLPMFVTGSYTEQAEIDWPTLEKAIRYGVRFLDNVLTYNMDKHPLPEQAQASRESRRIGLGFTGLADMLIRLRIKYDTQAALDFVDKLMDKMKYIAYDESTEIAKEKGSFGLFDADKHLTMPFIQGLSSDIREKIKRNGLRNVAILTIAPVGSGSALVGTSSGIEPVFAFSYTRRSESLSQEYFKVYHPIVAQYMAQSRIEREEDLPDFFVPAHKIKPEFRVTMQSVVQKHIDSSISSTVNLPEDVSVEQVEKIYFQGWKSGCKGITVYREGSREGILITDEKEKENQKARGGSVATEAKEWSRPKTMTGDTITYRMPNGAIYITVNSDASSPREVFVNMGRSGSDDKSYTEALGRLASMYLQQGGDVKSVIKSLKGIQGRNGTWDHGVQLLSVPDAIAKALETVINKTHQAVINEGAVKPKQAQATVSAQTTDGKQVGLMDCPKCAEHTLVSENGCDHCQSCGYSRCG